MFFKALLRFGFILPLLANISNAFTGQSFRDSIKKIANDFKGFFDGVEITPENLDTSVRVAKLMKEIGGIDETYEALIGYKEMKAESESISREQLKKLIED
jgi:hypothetical protein